MLLDSINRISLTHLPTPLDDAPRLASRLGLRKLLIKRDDCSCLGMGGNKVRKLEYLMADALDKGADVVLTDGGPQSNHARLTAAAARKVGIDRCILVLGGPAYCDPTGNLILDEILGAEVRFMENATVKEMEAAMSDAADELSLSGSTPYVIPIGGSTPLGVLGYVRAMRELSEQLGPDDQAPAVYVAVGSGGTFAGCYLGLKLFMPDAKLIGISVARKSKPLRIGAAKEAQGACKLLGLDLIIDPDEMVIDDRFYGDCYGVPSQAGNDTLRLMAQTEGIFLDPIYTAKAMSGLVHMALNNEIDTQRTSIFIHTGGAPAIFAEGAMVI